MTTHAPALMALLVSLAIAPGGVVAQAAKPNILVIFGDDIGVLDVSAYGRGLVGYTTPSIDRIAREGAIFTDYYGQQSCTAGRSAFITRQRPGSFTIDKALEALSKPSGSN